MKNKETSQEKSILLFASFQQAFKRFKEIRAQPKTETIRDATIQRFEFSFELAWKLLQAILSFKGFEVYGPRDSIRTAASIDLLDNPKVWFDFLKARNLTVHTYNEDMSEKVYEKAKAFVAEGEKLIEVLKEKVFCGKNLNP